MLDRSSKLDDSLMDAYRSIHEVHKGHAAGESDVEKQASQLASDIRYKAKGKIRDGMNSEDKKRIYLKLLASSPAPGIVKSKAKRKLLGESVLINEIMPAGDTAAERTASVKRVVRGGVKVGKRVARGVAGIAKREGTLSQKVTGAAIDAVKGRVGDVGSKVKSAAKKVSNWSKSDTTPSGKYSNVGSGRKEKVSSSQSSSSSSSSSSSKPSGGYPSKAERKASFKARVAKQRAAGVSMRGENFSDWRNELIGEEGYDHWRDKHLERGGIGAVASKSPSRPYTRSEKQPKGDTAYQKEMKAKYGGKLPSALQVVKDKIKKESGKGAIKETAADKIISSIRSERVDEGKLVHGPFGPYITGQKMPKEQREVPLRKVPYEDINSAKKVVGEAKAKYDNTKSPDYEKKKKALAKKHGGEENIKGHPQYEDYYRGTGEKVQSRTKKWMDKKGLKGAPGLDAMKARTKEHEKKRGVKEEVGVSSSAAMIKARKEAELKAKEESAVKKAKKAKNEEVAPAVDKVIESIKINKASPKSPNCIIMPKKDDITDKAGGNGKKSTKNVVSKKQKQFFNQEGKTYSSFLKEYLSTLTKAAAGQAAKGAITTTAKTVGKETVKQTGGAIVKSGGSAVAKQTGGAIVKSGGGQLAKKGGGAIVKSGGGKLATKGGAIVKSGGGSVVKSGGGSIVKSGGGKLATKGGALAKVKKTGKEIVKQTPSALANRDKGGELTKQEPQKQGNQSKGFNLPSLGSRTAKLKTGKIHNQQ